MRRLTAQSLAIAAAVAFAGCGFTPRDNATGTALGTGNVTGTPAGAGASSGTGATTGAAANTGHSNPDANCGNKTKPANKLLPDILIVLDKSGSMNEDMANMMCANNNCGPTSKWALMTPAINQVVTDTQMDVNWGLKFFADANGGQCAVNNTAAVAIGADRAPMIMSQITMQTDAMGGVRNGSRTPTRAAVTAPSPT